MVSSIGSSTSTSRDGFRLLVCTALGRREGDLLRAAEQFFERGRHRAVRRSERDRLAVRDRHLFFHGRIDHRERHAEFRLERVGLNRHRAGDDRDHDGRNGRAGLRIFVTRPRRDHVLDLCKLWARGSERLHDWRKRGLNIRRYFELVHDLLP
jgi:hypothetical protein